MTFGRVSVLMVCLYLLGAGTAHPDLEVLDKPMWMFPGQQVRVVLQQPEGSGELRVQVPPTLEMFDQWDQDSIQRYYFRALMPGDATLRFSGSGGELEMPLEVLGWNDVYQPREYKGVSLPRMWPMDDPDFDDIKTRRTMHSEAELEALRASGRVSSRAQRWLQTPDDEIYNTIPGPSVPRTCLMVLGSFEANRGIGKGCPVCGTDIYKGRSGFYPWEFRSEPLDWKVRCPECKTEFPSNDWQAGDMKSGPFPDDGFGCEPLDPPTAPDGGKWRWPFIAYYHQSAAYMGEFTPGIIETAQAYAATGDKAYAHKCAIALLRYSEAMVDMSLNLKHRKRVNRDGVYQWPVGAPIENRFHVLAGSFSYIQPNWDTPRMENAARAWDLIFDALDDSEELIRFAQANNHTEIQTIEDFRRFIEAGVIRVPVQMGMDNAVARNWPQQELMIASIALCLGTETSVDAADWLLNVNGIRFAVTNMFYRDGSAYESPSYNLGHIRRTFEMSDAIDRLTELYPELCRPPRFVSISQDPKARRLFDLPLEASLIGRTTPEVGDTGKAGPSDPLPWNQGTPCGLRDWIAAYRLTGDRRFAQAMYGPEGSLVESITDPRMKAVAMEAGQELGGLVQTDSNLLDGYGLAILRSGEHGAMRALWMRYARNLQHVHPDMLSYGLAGLSRDLLPELGYPEGWTHAGHWESNWGTHQKTKITGLRAASFNRGELTTFVGQPPVQVAAAESFAALGEQQCTRQRTMALVDVSPTEFYVVTVERVQGGEEHTFSFHGPDGEVTPENLQLQPYEGTALGERLKYGDFSKAAERDGELSCLAFMYDPARANPSGIWSLNYDLRGQDDVCLRMHNVYPEGGELVVAKGSPIDARKIYEISWAVLTSQGEAPLTRQYLNVIEPYVGRAAIRGIERVPVSGGDPDAQFEPLAVRVTTEQFVDTIILQHQAGAVVIADGISFDGEFGLWRERNGELEVATLVRGTRLTRDDLGVTMDTPEYTAQIVQCDWEDRAIVISPAPPDASAMPGRHIRITNPYGNSVSYQIRSAETVGDGCRMTFDLDPRIGEGFVKGTEDAVLVSETFLRLYPHGYYTGKTIANETSEVLHHISEVPNGYNCRLVEEDNADLSAATLEEQFGDLDGDGLKRFLIYDYGPGDLVTVANLATVTRRGQHALLMRHTGGAEQVTVIVKQP